MNKLLISSHNHDNQNMMDGWMDGSPLPLSDFLVLSMENWLVTCCSSLDIETIIHNITNKTIKAGGTKDAFKIMENHFLE